MNEIDKKETDTIDSTTFAAEKFPKKSFREDIREECMTEAQSNQSLFLIKDNSKDMFAVN